jgi:hypothetical protein
MNLREGPKVKSHHKTILITTNLLGFMVGVYNAMMIKNMVASEVFEFVTIRVVNPGIPNPGMPAVFGIVKSRDLNFGIFGIILIPGFAYRDPGPFGIDFIN